MEKLPKKINSVMRDGIFVDHNHARGICFTINRKDEDKTTIYAALPEYYRPQSSSEIVFENSEFVNGFKVVQTANGEYGYIRESDHLLLPYRYDIAFDFNEYGFAIAGKDACVTWIDTEFRHLNKDGDMIQDIPGKCWLKKDGWQEVCTFSEGEIPLSRLYDGRNFNGTVAYFGIDGKLRDFYRYDGEIDDFFPRTTFSNGTSFDQSGVAKADDSLLFARGYFIPYVDLLDMAMDKGFIHSISQEVDPLFDKETGNVLVKRF